MNIMFFLLAFSLLLAGLALAFFLWTIYADQYADPEGDAERILFADEDRPL